MNDSAIRSTVIVTLHADLASVEINLVIINASFITEAKNEQHQLQHLNFFIDYCIAAPILLYQH
jgi:hypothetical protein